MDGGTAFYGIQLSDNLELTPEGYLKCYNAVIGRTGVQQYRFADLPQEEAAELGLRYSPDDLVDLHRDPEDVFDEEFIDSLNGKPVTHLHPPKLLTADTVLDHSVGHMQDVRRGTDLLSDGNTPLLATLVILCKNLIAKIRAGLRELSCGYTYHIALDGNRILQVDMTGNHVAVLPIGRAGREGRINDGAPQERTLTIKERLQILFGHGLAEAAKTATPAELGELAVAGAAAMDHAEPAAAADAGAAAAAAETARLARESQRRQEGPGARDTRRRAGTPRGLTAMDEADREAAHAVVDEMIDARSAEAEEHAAVMEDARGELLDLLGAPASDADDMTDEEREEAAAAAEDEGDADEQDAAAAADEGAGYSDLIPVGERPRAIAGLDRAERGTRQPAAGSARDRSAARRSATASDAGELLRRLRPVVARTRDSQVRAAFDREVSALRPGRGVRRSGAGYDGFGRAAAAHAQDGAATPSTPESLAAAATAAYAKAREKKTPAKDK